MSHAAVIPRDVFLFQLLAVAQAYVVVYPVGHSIPLAEPSDNRKNAVILDRHFRSVLSSYQTAISRQI